MISLALCVLMALLASADPREAGHARRVVSLTPSLTAIVVGLGASESLVGVDDISARQVPELSHLPRVGGLFNPSLEAVVALEPDLVVLVPSVEQRDFRRRLEQLGIPVSVFDNISFDDVLENIDRLGRLLGREVEAAHRLAAIASARGAVAAAVAKRPVPRALIVLQRDPIYLVGAGNFLDEMLTVAGGENLGRAFAEAYPRVASEWLVAAAPDVLIDLSEPEGRASDVLTFWARWPSIPAVRTNRILRLDPKLISLPGPDLDRSLLELAVALHGREILPAIAKAREVAGGPEIESVP